MNDMRRLMRMPVGQRFVVWWTLWGGVSAATWVVTRLVGGA